MEFKETQKLIDEHTKDLIDVCPHCGAKVHIEKLWNDYHSLSNGDIEFYVVFRCKPCQKLILKTFYFSDNSYHPGNYTSKGWDEKYPILLDSELPKQDSENIPEKIFVDYREALKCKSIGAKRASCSMFRRALQSSLIELGADKKIDLIGQINSLGNLPNDLRDWAHQVRIFGNWGAHPDKDNLKDVDEDDVIEAHEFISKFFVYTFIMPQKVAASRKRREVKINNNNLIDN